MVLGAAESAVLAFDVGGTDLKAGLVDASGNIRGLRRIPTPRDPGNPGDAIVDAVGSLAAEFAAEFPAHAAKAACVIVPGIVDSDAGIGIYSANLGWRNFPFREKAMQRLGLPLAFGHDVSTAAEAEFRFGAARDYRNVVVMVIGTGIAAAVISDGYPLRAGGFAGELGHALVPDPDGKGHTILEAVGSAGGIARRYSEKSGTPRAGAREVIERANAGDPLASRIWADAVDALAFSLSQCVSIIGTEAVVVGGGLAEAGDRLLDPLRMRLDKMLDFQRRPVIVRAQLGQDAGLLGAALRARALLPAAKATSGTGVGR
ncbi:MULTISPECIES: ROK family protein [Arthrobacter]|uniref:ROK family protein n=1 Tax=Arthrobacter terricola TaxID=2547396 RepID=A0A4R5L113_9MICC|nr:MULTISPECIES: ROK family protein [Arthrobacter]MBT8160058.1 ROK family protein [Arthrobacter sp. GN70]TDG01061.1 ROK family protein [Arthrobacter terricola]